MSLLGRSGSKLPEGGYTPEELGLYKIFHKIPKIYIEKCGLAITAKDSIDSYDVKSVMGQLERPLSIGYNILAHTHLTKGHISYKTVCIRQTIFDSVLKMDVLWHEYGHVLNTARHMNLGEYFSDEEIHDTTFRKIMCKLKKEHLVKFDNVSADILGIIAD